MCRRDSSLQRWDNNIQKTLKTLVSGNVHSDEMRLFARDQTDLLALPPRRQTTNEYHPPLSAPQSKLLHKWYSIAWDELKLVQIFQQKVLRYLQASRFLTAAKTSKLSAWGVAFVTTSDKKSTKICCWGRLAPIVAPPFKFSPLLWHRST